MVTTETPRLAGRLEATTRPGRRPGRANEIRILVFDCWLPGFLYIRHLADMEGVSLTFVHNSESQMGQPAQDYTDFKEYLSIPEWVQDFRAYRKSFRCLFEDVDPDIVLVLSMHYVECRSALLFAKAYGVPGAYIPHGIFPLDSSMAPASSPTKGGAIRRLIQKIPRAIYYTDLFWSAHFQRDPGHRGPLWLAWSCYFQLLFRYTSWQWVPAVSVQRYYSNLLDVAIVYDHSLEKYYSENSGEIFAGTEFIVSGTLDTGKLLQTLRAHPSGTSGPMKPYFVAYYVSSPYPDDFSEEGAGILAELLGRLQTVVKAAGCSRLIYRPHPGEPLWFVERVCALGGIERDGAPGMEGLVAADLICGTTSSLLYNAVILSKSIVIASSRRFKMDLPYYEPLISYPKVTLDLDLDAETLIKNHGDALSEAVLRCPGDLTATLSDPIEVLLEIARRPSRQLLNSPAVK